MKAGFRWQDAVQALAFLRGYERESQVAKPSLDP
jgi:hypothetical protein